MVNGKTGCHDWMRARNIGGYGVMQANGRVRLVTRLVYELNFGAIPEGMMVLHSCDNPACVNIDHLRIGTAKDNTNDMIMRNRQLKGSAWSFSKLKEDDVLRIIELSMSGESHASISKIYNVSKWSIDDILKGRNWSWLTGINFSTKYDQKHT
jgi:hypothetical protein